MSCLDGVQPTAGPVPSEADMAEPTEPDGWDGGEEGVTPNPGAVLSAKPPAVVTNSDG